MIGRRDNRALISGIICSNLAEMSCFVVHGVIRRSSPCNGFVLMRGSTRSRSTARCMMVDAERNLARLERTLCQSRCHFVPQNGALG